MARRRFCGASMVAVAIAATSWTGAAIAATATVAAPTPSEIIKAVTGSNIQGAPKAVLGRVAKIDIDKKF